MTVERVITVKYLEPTMSRVLLDKFPDNSAFDFDYSQSGIWSPLLPRGGGIGCHGPASLLLDDARKKLLAGSPVTPGRVKAKLTYKKQKATRKSLDFSSSFAKAGVEEGVEGSGEALQSPWKIAAADDAAGVTIQDVVSS
ncbi:hypothetical protein MUK42_36198 [Musa troglodytarum]|uniref:Uncharacterized protein n=1 Tax=Musa troglodytarum TaxID=320322 RepID=A0A9E7HI70_9LILI|nr:hypothetical protein MUK42_36198 [Musa troglodytarum]